MTVNLRVLTVAGVVVTALATIVGLFATGTLQFGEARSVGTGPGVSVPDQHIARRPSEDQWTVGVAGKWTPTLHAYGTVSDFREVAISAAFPVRVVTTDVELGQHVSQGQELARVEAPQLRVLFTRIDTARNRQTVAAAELKRVQDLEKKGLATAPKVVAAEVAQLQAKRDSEDAWQELRQALVSLGQDPTRDALVQQLKPDAIAALARKLSVVRAPFVGVVVQRGAMPGVTSKAGTVLFALEDVSQAYVDVGIVPNLVSQWNQGSVVVDLLGQHIPLQPTATVGRLDPATGLMIVRYRCDVTDPVQVEGARLPVTLQADEQSVTWVPASAVVSRDGKAWCLVADKNGNPIPVRVQAGAADGDRIPLLEGVAAGQRVLAKDAYEYLCRDLNELLKFQD